MAKPKPTIDAHLIRELAQLLEETGLSEIEIERDGQRIRVARPLPGAALAASTSTVHVEAPATSPAARESALSETDLAKHPGLISSPMVGTAYRGPEPGAMPFVDVGSQVTAGATLLIIEAMKTMN